MNAVKDITWSLTPAQAQVLIDILREFGQDQNFFLARGIVTVREEARVVKLARTAETMADELERKLE